MIAMVEQELQQLLKNVEASQAKLRKFNEAFRHFYLRLEAIYVQYKKRLPITDISFEEDFRLIVEDLRSLADENQLFWQDVRNQYYGHYKKDLNQDYRFIIKQIKSSALAFTRQTDELFTIYKNLQTLGADLPLKLNWWLFENSTQTLLNTTTRILYIVRSMEKIYA